MKNSKKLYLIVIIGPTASGKSDLGIRLAKKFNGEIISADSRQVYKGLDIGTGKVLKDKTFPVPKSKIKNQNLKSPAGNLGSPLRYAKFKNNHFYSKGIRHHLINVVNPKKQFTVDDFKNLGQKAIKEISAKNKIPIIVGGTGFYIDVLLDRIQIPEVPPNKKLRTELEKLPTKKLFQKLKKLNPERTKSIDSKNKRRVIRALEIVITRKKFIPKCPNQTNQCLYPYHDRNMDTSLEWENLWLGIKTSQRILEKKIKIRLDKRIKEGLLREIQKLIKNGISYKKLFDLGLEYRYVSQFIKTNPKSVVRNPQFLRSPFYEKLLRNIIKYSRRQITWFKRNKDIKWIKNEKDANRLIKKFLFPFS